MDSVHAIVPKEGKEELRSVLTDEEYAMIVKGTPVKIKWFFLLLTELMCRIYFNEDGRKICFA